jgi:hypothetical protein
MLIEHQPHPEIRSVKIGVELGVEYKPIKGEASEARC